MAEYKVGDVMRVRQRRGIENDPTYQESNICFVSAMESLCGKFFTICKVYQHHGETCYLSEEKVEYNEETSTSWLITSPMLEPADIEAEDFDIASESECLSFLFGSFER